jgi:O-antigen/teichoic acid export membrane protein
VGSPPAEEVETGAEAPAPHGDLRRRVARGTLVNAVFNVGLQLLGFFKGFIVAGFLTASEYGVWGLLVISLGTLLWLAQLGIDDKYVQQDHPDQEKAFQLAFTLQCMLAGVFMLILAIGVPLFALAYDKPEIIAPGLVLTLAMPTAALDTPLWVYYRKMDFLKQRRLALWDPITAFFVTIALAVAGAGYWALVLGTLLGAWAGAIVAVRSSPYKLRLYYEKGTLREYATFSWPILIQNASGVLVAQLPILFVQRHVGTAAVGAITLAGTISLYANRVDSIVTQALYPAIARVKDKPHLLFEAFTKSNRLALMWGVPCGVGIALFADDVVHYVLGDKWAFAIPVIQIMALAAGFNQFGFNWGAFYKARNNTRPIAIAGVTMMVAVLALAIPLTYSNGVKGYALGMALATAILIVLRCYWLARLFPTFALFSHAVRAMWPTVPAVAAVLAIRAADGGPRSAATAAAEAAVYVIVLAIGVFFAERSLMREVIGYLRRGAVSGSAA